MRIAVAGGTGIVGSHVVRELATRGHEAVVLARSRGVELTTGTGLDQALRGVEAVIDVSNTPAMRRDAARAFFGAVTGNLLRAERRADVAHHVALSIVGIDRVPLGYYQGKLHQEQLCLAPGVPATVLRATQLHEFPAQLLRRMPRLPVVPVPLMLAQTVSAREVASALVAAALAPPAGRLPDLGGPQVERVDVLIRRILRASHQPVLVVPLALPGRLGRAIAQGGLLLNAAGRLGSETFAQWLSGDDARPWL